jgi:hypothetical protein
MPEWAAVAMLVILGPPAVACFVVLLLERLERWRRQS